MIAICSTTWSHILHLEGGKTTLYQGGYDDSNASAANASRRPKRRESNKTPSQKLQAYIDRWRYKAHTARQAQSRMKALAKMQPIAAAARTPRWCSISRAQGNRPPLIALDDAAVGYEPGTPVLSHLGLRLDPDDRIAVGPQRQRQDDWRACWQVSCSR